MYVADRNAEMPEFVKITDKVSSVQDVKFSSLGIVLSTGNSVLFVPKSKLSQILDKHRLAALNEAKSKGKASSKVPRSPNFTKVVPIEISRKQHVLETDTTALLKDLKPVKLIDLEKDEIITEIDFFDDSIMLYINKVSQLKLLFANLSNLTVEKDKAEVEFKQLDLGPDARFGQVKPGVNHNSLQTDIRFFVDTPFSYAKAYDYHISTGKVDVIDQTKISGKKFDWQQFEITVVHAPTSDGCKVPITLIHKKGMVNKHGLPRRVMDPQKLLLKSYGCYGMNLNLDFSVANWSLLERDWILAFAHIRGGSELGKEWHTSATKNNKYKSVQDIISSAEYLVANGFTHPSLLCADSNSAGAGLLASSVNMNPTLFKAVHYNAPFLDIQGCLIDPDQPLSQSDYTEFGNPTTDSRAFDSISSLCPYTNLKPADYPATLITAFADDYRTPLWSVLKYTAKLRDAKVKHINDSRMLHKDFRHRVADINEGNVCLIVDEGSHVGTDDCDANTERAALVAAYYEWIVEEKSLDVHREKKKVWQFWK